MVPDLMHMKVFCLKMHHATLSSIAETAILEPSIFGFHFRVSDLPLVYGISLRDRVPEWWSGRWMSADMPHLNRYHIVKVPKITKPANMKIYQSQTQHIGNTLLASC